MISQCAVFIDGGHVNSILDGMGRIRINYGDFVSRVVGGKRLMRTYYYDCPPYQSNPATAEEIEASRNREKFFHALRKLDRFEIRLGYLAFKGYSQEGKPILTQKSTDIRLAVDMVTLSLAGVIDTAFLVAADGDFSPAVESVKAAGVSVHLLHGNPYSQSLWEICDERTPVDWNFLQDCLLK